VTIVVGRRKLIEAATDEVAAILSYKTHLKNDSLYNTPPSFGVYVLDLVLSWIDGLGGLTAMAARNGKKAKTLYDVIDQSGGFYKGHAEPGSR